MSLFISVALDEGLTNLETEVYSPGTSSLLEAASMTEYVARSGYYHGSLSGDYDGYYEVTLLLNDSVYAHSYIDVSVSETGVIIGDPRLYDDEFAALNGRLNAVITKTTAASSSVISTTGFPDCFILGDSYIDELNTNIKYYLRDEDGVALSGMGSYSFATADLTFAGVSQSKDVVNFMVSYVDPSGADPYFNLELPAASSVDAIPNLEYKAALETVWASGDIVKTFPSVTFQFDEDCIC